tara:strand:- start:2696 stop:3265 length:570 start_codon:yes stop_codon:yes gene_type:complete
MDNLYTSYNQNGSEANSNTSYNQNESEDNLYTSGGQYLTPDGVEYVGFYHIMDGESIMTGKTHDSYSLPLENLDLSINFDLSVYSKAQYSKVIDTSFTQLGVQTVQEQLDDQPTVNEFFELYNELFYDIPETGESNSHEALIKQSTEYIAFDEINEEIDLLRKEITQLRIDLLDSQKQTLEIQTGINLE